MCTLLVQPEDERGGTGNYSVMKRGFKHKIILFVTISGNSFTPRSHYLSLFFHSRLRVALQIWKRRLSGFFTVSLDHRDVILSNT